MSGVIEKADAQDKGDLKPASRVDNWHRTHDRVFLGGQFWANPMEDWRVVDGAAECQTSGGDRNIQLITHQLTNADGEFSMSVDLTQVEVKKKDGGAGFRIGLRSELNEYRSNSFAKGGISAGVIGKALVLSGRRISDPSRWIPTSPN